MNERQRMQYLEALGVDSFIPRWLLPAAQVPRHCVLPSAAVADATFDAGAIQSDQVARSDQIDSGSRVDAGSNRQQSNPAGALLATISPQTTSPWSPPSAPQSPPEMGGQVALRVADRTKAADEKVAFSLAFWRVHPHVMVVDTRRPAQALPTEALLRAIVAGVGLAPALPRAEIQNWPLAGGGSQGWDAAREMIQAFLESRLLSQPVCYLVLMGGDAVQAVLGEPEVAAIGDRVRVDTFACEALIAPSLTQLLLEPRRKAMLWDLLAPLRHLQDEQ